MSFDLCEREGANEMRAGLSLLPLLVLLCAGAIAADETQGQKASNQASGSQEGENTNSVKEIHTSPAELLSTASGKMPLVTTPDLTGVKVNFGSVLGQRVMGSDGKWLDLQSSVAKVDQEKVDQEEEVSNLGVAVEGLGITLMKVDGDKMVTRINLGPEDRFRFHRDSTYDPQAYMRAREIEREPGTRTN
jgi:hypothetical protein